MKYKTPDTRPCEEYLENLEGLLPELCTVNDLLRVGIYRSCMVAHTARKAGNCPTYFQQYKGGKVLYPRSGVIAWLREKINLGLDETPCD
jgi:hypothetical protein